MENINKEILEQLIKDGKIKIIISDSVGYSMTIDTINVHDFCGTPVINIKIEQESK